ncbi:3-mercaptopyruvate sulfurtransferase-like isoform X2 [Babylonia areolata]|uniref:3-mercaptopyruvate sulfurtransferase-like isoform X2 n=1 Tax=Babylonia areolata TaxID=304850 RepID=UPI003FCF4363
MNKVGAVVSVKWVADMLATRPKNFRILDASWHLPNSKRNGRAEYAREHIPEASFFDIDMCADQEAKHLQHMLPKPEQFETYVGRMGINNDTHVVVYDNNDKFPLFSAQRVWWTFRVFGHENVSVMEGGLRQWRKENNRLTGVLPEVTKEKFTACFNAHLVKSFEDIEANQFHDKVYTLLDARPAGRFIGKAPEPRPGIKPGSIPGSCNLPFTELMDIDRQKFKSKEELLGIFEQLSIDLSKPVAVTCGSGSLFLGIVEKQVLGDKPSGGCGA